MDAADRQWLVATLRAAMTAHLGDSLEVLLGEREEVGLEQLSRSGCVLCAWILLDAGWRLGAKTCGCMCDLLLGGRVPGFEAVLQLFWLSACLPPSLCIHRTTLAGFSLAHLPT